MPDKSQCCLEEKDLHRESSGAFELHHRMPDGKLVANVQICLRCGRKFPPRRGRKNCPCCQGLLRTRTLIMKFH